MAQLPSIPREYEQVAPPTVARCQLLPNPWLMRNALGLIGPWFGAIMLVLVVNGLLETMGLFATIQGQFIGIALILPIIVFGLVLTLRQSVRRGDPVMELEIDTHELSARDLKTGAITFTARRAALTCRRGLHRYNLGRGGRFEHAVLIIETPGQKPLSIGVADARFSWVDSSATLRAPRYVVSAADWSGLAQALGLFGALRASG